MGAFLEPHEVFELIRLLDGGFPQRQERLLRRLVDIRENHCGQPQGFRVFLCTAELSYELDARLHELGVAVLPRQRKKKIEGLGISAELDFSFKETACHLGPKRGAGVRLQERSVQTGRPRRIAGGKERARTIQGLGSELVIGKELPH
ncbi:MAG: hypothetical protein BWZ01_03060 [Deltaproteobacteria bacterium ADurb.BinA179]|nr:MAG: hypothetical protein BWZ01_03060 [Deltaproteobacteria bacterium ADurb.BinA179]